MNARPLARPAAGRLAILHAVCGSVIAGSLRLSGLIEAPQLRTIVVSR